MATRPIVPRANGEGSLGVDTAGSPKYWGAVFTDKLDGANAQTMANRSIATLREANTAYLAGEKRVASSLSVDYILVCKVSGTTANADITLPATIVDGATFTDGTVTWQIQTIATTVDLGYRLSSTAYDVKDIRYSLLLPTGWYLECTTAGTSGSGDITLPSSVVENAVVTDGTVTWKIRRISSADGVGVGIILPFAGNGNIPSGYLLCDGAAYSRTAFPDLFACIGTDYGSGDGSTTFNLPNLVGKFAEGAETAGQTKEAGLPNITGEITNASASHPALFGGGSYKKTGALQGGTEYQHISVSASTTNTGTNINFDASLSNPIYGNSDTVQPPALTVRYIIKAFDGQTADSALIDITQFENELGGKADRSLSNLTATGLAKLVGTASLADSGYQVLGSGLIVQWTKASFTGNYAWTFPIEFPNKCIYLGGCSNYPNSPIISFIEGRYSTSGANMHPSYTEAMTAFFIAIGY